MSRSVCTNRSSIVLMSLVNSPMNVVPLFLGCWRCRLRASTRLPRATNGTQTRSSLPVAEFSIFSPGFHHSAASSTRRSENRLAHGDLIAQIAAEHTAHGRTHRAEQQRHESPERKIRRRLARRVGGLGRVLLRGIHDIVDPLLGVVLAQTSLRANNLRQIGTVVTGEPLRSQRS